MGLARLRAGLREDLLQLRLVVAQRLLGLLDRDVAATDQRLGVELAHRALVVDQVVHQRLGQRRVVGLVVTAAAVADHVDDDVLVERLRGTRRPAARRGRTPRGRRRSRGRSAPGSSRATSVAYIEDRLDAGDVVKPTWLLTTTWIGAAGAVAAQLRQLQRLGDDALARERRVAVHQQRQHGEAPAPRSSRSCLARTMPSSTGSTASRCEGLATSETSICSPSGRGERALGAQVVLHVAGAVHVAGVDGCPRTRGRSGRSDLPTMLASTLRRPRCGMPMHDLVEPGARRRSASTASSSGMTDSPPSSENRFWPTYLVCRNVSKASAALSRRRMRSCSSRSMLRVRTLDALLDPLALLGVLDVHVLDADGAAVRVAQHAEDVAQLGDRLAAEAAGGELAVEVPQRQPVRDDVEVGVLALAVLQRVGVGHEVAAHPVGVDQLLDAGGLGDVVLVRRR